MNGSEGIAPRISDKMLGGMSGQFRDPAALPPYPLEARVQPENILIVFSSAATPNLHSINCYSNAK
jgi:hypothetical protein